MKCAIQDSPAGRYSRTGDCNVGVWVADLDNALVFASVAAMVRDVSSWDKTARPLFRAGAYLVVSVVDVSQPHYKRGEVL